MGEFEKLVKGSSEKTNSDPSNADKKPLSEKAAGYFLATLGGLLGGPLGLIASPLVLFGLNKSMQAKGGKAPNRFRAWALAGIIGAPLSLGVFGGLVEPQSAISSGSSAGSSSIQAKKVETLVTHKPVQPKVNFLSAGDFTLSDISISRYRGDTGNADIAGELWVVHANVKNTGKETKVPAYSLRTSLKDSQGRMFKKGDFAISINSIVNESFGGQKVTRFTDGVLPGLTRKRVEVGVFDVSPGAQGLKLCIGRLFGSTRCAG